MKIINEIRRGYNEKFIREFSDTELVDKYNFMKKEIESRREITGLGLSRDIEFKYQLLKEIKKRGLSYE